MHVSGSGVIHKVLPPAVTGAVVMLIGFNLAPVVAGVYWPQDQWIALAVATFMVCAAVLLPGFWARIAVLLALVFGYLLSWLADLLFGQINSVPAPTSNGEKVEHDRVSWSGGCKAADWIGFPSGKLDDDGVSVVHAPSFSLTFILLVLPGVIALIAENTGHVKAVAEMTKTDLDPYMGRALFADGAATALSSAFGGSPTTTYAENIGVMGATKVYSTAAYYVAAVVAILLGLCPKFGAIVSATPGGVLGGITVILYGMIGLVGAKIWVENGVDFGDPVNLVGSLGGHHRRHRRRHAGDHQGLLAERDRARHHPGDRVLPPGQLAAPAPDRTTRPRRCRIRDEPADGHQPGHRADPSQE